MLIFTTGFAKPKILFDNNSFFWQKGTKREVEGDQNQNEELEEHEVANARGEFEDSGVTTAFGNIFTLF